MVDKNDNPKPAYMEAAARLSKLLHVPEERLLDDIPESRSYYPDPNCLLPDEVADYQRNRPIEPERLIHAKSCVFCNSLLEAAAPNRNLERAFLEEVERSSAPEPSQATVEPIRPSSRTWGFIPAFALSLASVAAVVLGVANIITLSHYNSSMAALQATAGDLKRSAVPLRVDIDTGKVAQDVVVQLRPTLTALQRKPPTNPVSLDPLQKDIRATQVVLQQYATELKNLISQAKPTIDSAALQAAIHPEIDNLRTQLATLQRQLTNIEGSVRSPNPTQLQPVIQAAVTQAVQNEFKKLNASTLLLPADFGSTASLRFDKSNSYSDFLMTHDLRVLPVQPMSGKTAPQALSFVDKNDSRRQVLYYQVSNK
jgi:hypothetical protein